MLEWVNGVQGILSTILFRGKSVHNGEWVEGRWLFEQYINCPVLCIANGTISANDYSEILGDWDEIIPNTLGLYIGREDKNGVKIFTGDIIKGKFRNYIVRYDEDERGFVYSPSIRGGYRHSFAEYLLGDYKRLEVIGNIFDNLELMEATE